ncbi:MAG TPA: HAMP domain-containing sensor histidine kinase, partial [Hyphomicrobiaceae bacterium]|nr:HAMP domain-containing sensor histidine kinase [Hyphomicrobiaceae bacterium]
RVIKEPGYIGQEFDLELMAMFVRNELQALPTVPLLAMIFALASMFWAPVIEASLWLVAVILSKFLMVAACRRFERLPAHEVDVAAWARYFVKLEFVSGLAWAALPFVGNSVVTPASQAFILVSLVVLIAIRMTFASTMMSIIYVGTLPMTLAVVITLIAQNHPFYFAMASMAAGLHVYFIFMARRLNETALAMLEFRSEKDQLIADLAEAKAISDTARLEAEAASVAKSRFLATMSHELRTPLNAILGFSEVMKTELIGPMANPTYKDYATSIHDSGAHLLNLINEILDLSRIEAGRYELVEEPIRLADVVDDCWRLLRLRAEGKNQTVTLDVPPSLPDILVDQRAIRQVCLNLLSNALKFTPRGGQITVGVRALADGGQSLVVRDNGPGIPASEMSKVLQPFGQGSLAHETAEGGTGLGLPIVKSLVELHGGQFVLTSALRKGTTAEVLLPADRVQAARRYTGRVAAAGSAQRPQGSGDLAERDSRPQVPGDIAGVTRPAVERRKIPRPSRPQGPAASRP